MATSVGLIIDIIGVVILFFNGVPIFPTLPDGAEILFCSTGSNREREKLQNKKILLSKIALGCIIIGFIFQFIGSVSKGK